MKTIRGLDWSYEGCVGMSRLAHLVVIAALALTVSLPGLAQTPLYPAAESRWAGVIRAGGTVDVRLVRGSIRAETGSGQKVTIIVIRRGVRSDPMATGLSINTTGTDLGLSDHYPALINAVGRVDCLPPLDARGDFWHSDVRFDVVLRLPPNIRLLVNLLDGDIDVRALSGLRGVSTIQGTILGEARRS